MQLTLSLSLRDEATFDNFYKGANAHVVRSLHELLSGDGEWFLYLWGQSSTGRSHLLQACCHASSEQQAVAYLALRDNTDLQPAMLEGLEQLSLVCLDDIDSVMGNAAWEEALFHFYNRAKEAGTCVLMSANAPPKQLRCQLADLQSRLSAGLVSQLQALNDDQKILALQLRASRRGLRLQREVAQYVLRHYPRDMSALFHALETLDRASMVAKRPLTIPFVRDVLVAPEV